MNLFSGVQFFDVQPSHSASRKALRLSIFTLNRHGIF